MAKFRTYELAKEFYRECLKTEFKGAASNQFERACLSIVLNLSEGSAKPTPKDRAKFYYIAYGSLRETRTILELNNVTRLDAMADILSAHIWKLAKNPGAL